MARTPGDGHTVLWPRKKNAHAVALGKRGGKVSSPAKAAAVRENGKRGGRPRKAQP